MPAEVPGHAMAMVSPAPKSAITSSAHNRTVTDWGLLGHFVNSYKLEALPVGSVILTCSMLPNWSHPVTTEGRS